MRRIILPLIVIASLIFIVQANAHDFYSTYCCSGHDCHPVACTEISEVKDGFNWMGFHFDKSMEIPSQDNQCHVCIPKMYNSITNSTTPTPRCIYTLQGS